jgi:hypothetical protein
MKRIANRLLLLDGNVYAFVSATMLSVSVNVYTGLFSTAELPTRWMPLSVSAATSALAAWCFGRMAWVITEWRRGRSDRPIGLSDHAVEGALVEKYGYVRVVCHFVLGAIFSLVCVGSLLFGIKLPGKVTDTSTVGEVPGRNIEIKTIGKNEPTAIEP